MKREPAVGRGRVRPGGALGVAAALALLPSCTIDSSGVNGVPIPPALMTDGGVGPPVMPAPYRDGSTAPPEPTPLPPPPGADGGSLPTPVPDARGMTTADGPPTTPTDAPTTTGPCLARCLDPMTLRSCPTADRACPLGCSDIGAAPHCRVIVPTGGGVVPEDLETTGVQAVTISTTTTLHSDTGQIEGVRAAGPAVVAGIRFQVVNGVAVFTTGSLTLGQNATLRLEGPNPVALVSTADIVVAGSIDARGTCQGTAPGPGGGAGGMAQRPGAGLGGGAGGMGTHDNATGGAGAGHGVAGGGGGSSRGNMGPTAGGRYEIARLAGGSGGGGGGGPLGGVGGGGGGAIQLVARGTITIRGGVNAGGCGGRRGPDDAGGGGGSGGTILIEAPVITLTAQATLAVNGGGGGGSDDGSTDGQPGQLAAMRSPGGTGNDENAADGGRGGASTALEGEPGRNGNNAGGGGGGVGRILLHTASGTANIAGAATMSPRLSEPMTTAVQRRIEMR